MDELQALSAINNVFTAFSPRPAGTFCVEVVSVLLDGPVYQEYMEAEFVKARFNFARSRANDRQAGP